MLVRQFAGFVLPRFTTWVSCQANIVSDSTTVVLFAYGADG